MAALAPHLSPQFPVADLARQEEDDQDQGHQDAECQAELARLAGEARLAARQGRRESAPVPARRVNELPINQYRAFFWGVVCTILPEWSTN